MSKVIIRKSSRIRRRLGIRKNISGTAEMPRLSVFKSNKYIIPQVINDEEGKTLASLGIDKIKELHKSNNKQDAAYEVGKEIAKVCAQNKIERVVFDRGGFIYHGRVKKLAEGAREGGLKF